jgi:hypothetical protein
MLIRCCSCTNEATQMFHFREEGQSDLKPYSHVPTCDLHSLSDRPRCAECLCTESWEVIMDRERAKLGRKAAH